MSTPGTADRTGLSNIIPLTPMADLPLWRQTILLGGEPKIGKTTTAKKLFKDAIFLDGEQGTLGLDVITFENLLPNRDRVNSPISIWEDVLEATTLLERAKGQGIEGTVVIDPAQAIFDMARNYVQRLQGWVHESDVGYGKAWSAVNAEFSQWVSRIKSIGFGIVFVAHVKDVDIETSTAKFQRKIPRLTTGARNLIEPWVNMIWFAEIVDVQGKQCRVLHTKPSDKIMAGERGENPKLQALLPFDADAIQRNYNGETIDLNEWFGIAQPTQPVQAVAVPVPASPPIPTLVVAADPNDLGQVLDANAANYAVMRATPHQHVDNGANHCLHCGMSGEEIVAEMSAQTNGVVGARAEPDSPIIANMKREFDAQEIN